MVAADLLAFGERLGTTVYVLGDNELLKKHEGVSKGRSIAAQIALGHLHVYKSARFARTMKITQSRPMPSRVLASETRKRTADFETWEPWAKKIKAGEFLTTDLQEVREQDFMSTRRMPKCYLKDSQTPKGLVYTATSADDSQGQCVVHSVPEEHAA